MMDKEELIAFLKEKLEVSVQVDSYCEYYSSEFKVKVQLKIDDEVISSSIESFSLENERY